MDRSMKQELVETLQTTLKASNLVVVTELKGLTVAELTDFRRKMRAAGAGLKVAKNRLARRALTGTDYAQLDPLFRGPTAIGYSVDPVAAAKIAVNYAKSNEKVTIKGGAMNGQLLDKSGIETLAALPSLDELRGKLVGVLVAPATKIAAVLQAPAGQLARVLNAHATKDAAA
ncbi:MAG: 50S ribosomal protein L10 [Candidatus Symbiobacter sp.]|nr:50S ribosomal protein L10 [Candidatus Symbiobacter sp.]